MIKLVMREKTSKFALEYINYGPPDTTTTTRKYGCYP